MSQLFSILASALIIAVIIIYFRQVVKGDSVPNPATWFIWSIIGVMNAISYFAVVRESLWQSLITLLAATGMTSIFLYSIVKGKFAKVGKLEIICFSLAVAIGVMWKASGDADIANLSLQAVYLVSFVPTIHGLLTHKLREKGLPWYLSLISYSCMIVAIVTHESFRWIALAHPIANGIIGNGTVTIIIVLQARKQTF
ncbi:MAG: hypothetical protein ABII13_01110 [Patescibacteria group bacterium]|nr:hypothetical protein [Patescibacteria group bacterium]